MLHNPQCIFYEIQVGREGFGPSTTSVSGRYPNQTRRPTQGAWSGLPSGPLLRLSLIYQLRSFFAFAVSSLII